MKKFRKKKKDKLGLGLAAAAAGGFAIFALKDAGGGSTPPPPPPGWFLEAFPTPETGPAGSVTLSIFEPIRIVVHGETGTPVGLWSWYEGSSFLFDWSPRFDGVIDASGVAIFTFTLFDLFGINYNDAPYVFPGRKGFAATPYPLASNLPPRGGTANQTTNVIYYHNNTRA